MKLPKKMTEKRRLRIAQLRYALIDIYQDIVETSKYPGNKESDVKVYSVDLIDTLLNCIVENVTTTQLNQIYIAVKNKC